MNWKTAVKKFVMGNLVRKESVQIPVFQGNLLAGRTALITGGSSGIGFAIARAFLDNGCEVVITGRNQERLEKACKDLDSKKVHPLVLNSAQPEEFDRAVIQAISLVEGGKIDILVNNAGVIRGQSLARTTVDDWNEVIDVNLRGAYFLSQAVARHMVDSEVEGNILNISSSSALRPADRPYSVSKWGVRGMTLGFAKSLIDHGIVVNGLAPGPTATPMLQGQNSGYLENDVVPAGRFAAPEEIANMAVVLVSSMGRMVVGDTVYMTGGSGLTTFEDMTYGF